MKSVLAVAAVAALSVSSATAADLAPHLITKAPPVAAAYDWTGFYVGVHGGYGWGRGETSAASIIGFIPLPAHPDSNPAGGFGGGQIGANLQFAPNWMIGIQADLSAFSAKDDGSYSASSLLGLAGSMLGSYSTRIDRLSSVTGRLGYAVNNVLFYGKGGAAWIHNRFHDASTTDLGLGIFVVDDFAGSATSQGWTVGGGVEYGITRHWTVGFEYDYYDFGSSSQTLGGAAAVFFGAPGVPAGPPTQQEPLQFKQTLSVAKASLNYRF